MQSWNRNGVCRIDWERGLPLLGSEAYALHLLPYPKRRQGTFLRALHGGSFIFDTTHFLGRTFMSSDVVLMIPTPFVSRREELKGGSLQLCSGACFDHFIWQVLVFSSFLSEKKLSFFLFVGLRFGNANMRTRD